MSNVVNPSRRKVSLAIAAGLAGVLPARSWSQRGGATVRLLVGFPPGGTFDTAARMLAEQLKETLGRNVIVENKSGAAGRLVVDSLKAGPNDGSVVMLGPDALTGLYPLTYKRLNYDPKTDLVPISPLVAFPYAFIAGSNPPVRTFAEYAKWAKENPSRANYGHAARGAPPHFLGLLLGEAIGVPMTDIPFQGGGPMATNLIGGQVSSIMNPLGGQVIEFHRAGKMRILALSSPQRMPQLPEVPTFAELGYPGMVTVSTNVLYAPANTSAATVAAWSRAVRKALENTQLKEQFAAMGFLAIPGGPEDVNAKTSADLKYWEPVIKSTGFSAD